MGARVKMGAGVRQNARRGPMLRAVCETVERRLLLCGLPHEHLIAPPDFDWMVEHREATRIAQSRSEGGPEAVSIVWSNRGQASDGFATAFGTSANAGRAVVDAALAHWERVITSWNRLDGTTTLQVNVSIATTNGYGASGAPAATAPADGKPRTGSFSISRGRPDLFPDPNDSNGWYFDPNPNDHAEFNASITNAFAGRGTNLGSDFYSVAVAELTHVLGLISDRNDSGGSYSGYRLATTAYTTNTGIRDNAEGGGNWGHFWVFQGPSIDHLMTSYNSGDQTSASWGNIVHSAGVRNGFLNFNGKQWQGSEDAGNAAYAGNERTLPSWVMANIFKDAYGYSIVPPERFDTFYALLNRNTGALTVRGGASHNTGDTLSNDVITIDRDGSELIVSVDVSNDIPGTRHLSGPGNLPAWVSRFPVADVTSILIATGNGNDSIRIRGLPANTPVTINANGGDDVIDIGFGDFDTNIRSNIFVNAGSGNDEIIVNDFTDGAGSDTVNMTANSFAKPATPAVLSWNASQLEKFTYIGSPNNDTINIASTSANTTYSINGFGGNDTLNVGGGNYAANILGPITFGGGAGTDTLVIDDSADSGTDTYQITGNQFSKTVGGGSSSTVTAVSGTELMVVNGGSGTNTWSVPQLSSFLNLTINGGSGIDNFVGFFNNNFDANLLSTLTFNGGGGTDSIVVNDQSGPGLDYFLSNNRLDKGGSGILMYSGVEAFTLNCNTGNNNITVRSTHSSTPVTINGNAGNDTLRVNDATSFLFNFGSNITFNGGSGDDGVVITDANFGGGGDYTIVNGRVFLPFNGVSVFFSDVVALSVIGSTGNNTINVNQTNIMTWVSGEDGDDVINVGNGNFAANITADVLVFGGNGNDIAIIQDTANAGNNRWTTTAGSTTHDGAVGRVLTSFITPTINALRIDAGAGNSVFNINSIGSASTAMNLTINAGAGNDTFNLAGSGGVLATNIRGVVNLNGQAGIDVLNINDINGGTSNYQITSSSLTHNGWAHGVSFSAVSAMTFDASTEANNINVTGVAGAFTIRGNGGSDVIDVDTNAIPPGASCLVDFGPGVNTLRVNASNSGQSAVRVAGNQTLNTLTIGVGGRLTVDPGGSNILRVNGSVTINGELDLNDNAFIRGAPGGSTPNPTFYRARLANGYAGGTWAGTGTSSILTSMGDASNFALGWAVASEIFNGTGGIFAGQSVEANAILIRYTRYGDANLDGLVNLADFNRLAANFGSPNTTWVRGDFDYNNTTNLADFNKLAANFGLSAVSAADGEQERGSSDDETVPSLESLIRGGDDTRSTGSASR